MSNFKINILPDCGNSPKKTFIKEFNIAFAKANVEFILKHISNDVVWNIYGNQSIKGKEDFAKLINKMANHTPIEMSIHQMITHGKEASVNGEIIMKDNKKYAFCDVYEFTSAGKTIIKTLHSYVIPV